jgi:NitT/TauT family transport system substrate-binding protein
MHSSQQPAKGTSRRSLLRGLTIAAGVGLGGSLLAACGSSGKSGKSSTALRPVKFGWWGSTCEAPLFVAHHQGFFDRQGLKVELVNLGQSSAKDALASGKVDAVPGITFEWLKPIEQGQNIRVTGGIHGGCLRLVAGSKTGITTLAGLRGKTIATDDIGGSAHSFFSVVLAANGIDPQKDVTFVKFPGAQLQTALQRGEAVAAAAADPFPFLIVAGGDGVELASNLTGAYQDHFCCALGINGDFIDESPATAAALTRGLLSASQWIGTHITETARIEADNKYVPIEAEVSAKLLATYTWKPGVLRLKDNLNQYAKEFKVTGILDKKTDPEELAKRAFRDVTYGDTGIDSSDAATSASPGASSSTHSTAHSSASATATATTQALPADTYQLTPAQRDQLLAAACHLQANRTV